jgi:PEP-CTERM motif
VALPIIPRSRLIFAAAAALTSMSLITGRVEASVLDGQSITVTSYIDDIDYDQSLGNGNLDQNYGPTIEPSSIISSSNGKPFVWMNVSNNETANGGNSYDYIDISDQSPSLATIDVVLNSDGAYGDHQFGPADTLWLYFTLNNSDTIWNTNKMAITTANGVDLDSVTTVEPNVLMVELGSSTAGGSDGYDVYTNTSFPVNGSFGSTDLDTANNYFSEFTLTMITGAAQEGGPAPVYPFSLDDQNINSGGTISDPTFSTLTSNSYFDAAGFTGQANDEVNVHGAGAGHDQSVYMNLIEGEYFNINSPTDFTYIAPSKVTFKYAGVGDNHTIDVLLKFITSDGIDPVTGQVLTDLVDYINDNNDDTLTAYAYNGDPTDAFPILDADGSANYPNSGWDILVQDTDVQGDPLASFDFSQFTDPNYGITAGSLEIAEIGVVPEPASMGLMALGATGLLIRRRRKKA